MKPSTSLSKQPSLPTNKFATDSLSNPTISHSLRTSLLRKGRFVQSSGQQKIACAFGLYIWCTGADPADLGLFKSKKYLNNPDHKNHDWLRESKLGGESTSSIHDANYATTGEKPMDKDMKNMDTTTKDRTTKIGKIGPDGHIKGITM